MAKKSEKLRNPVWYYPLFLPPWQMTPPAPEEITFVPKGIDVAQKKYEGIDTDEQVSQAKTDIDSAFADLISPSSPLTPDEAAGRALKFFTGVNVAAAALSLAVIAAESATAGFVDQTLMSLYQLPVVRSAFGMAARIQDTYLEAAILSAAKHRYLRDHLPTLVPERVPIDLYAKGLLSEADYYGYMLYQGYTNTRSKVMSYSAYNPPSPSTIIEMRRRGFISFGKAVDWLEWNKIPRETAGAIAKLAIPLLDPSYLATMVQKGWIPEPDYYRKMSAYGFSKEDANWMYFAAERPPSIARILELERRGLVPEVYRDKLWKSTQVQGWIVKSLQALKWQIPEPYRLAEMRSKRWISESKYLDAMSKVGYDKDWAWNWFTAQLRAPPFSPSLSLWRRGVISEETFEEYMAREQYTDEAIEQLKALKDVIPPLPDLIRFAVREAYGKHTFPEQYPKYEELAQKMGLTKEAAGWYWWAHWDRIALAQMYENLWRGYWTKDEFMRYLRLKDVHEEDREAIYNVAFRAPSIREMGYGYDMGVYTRDDIVRYRKWGGLSPLDAEKAADSLILYRTSAEIEAVRREWLWMFAHEKITEAEFLKALKDLETPAEAIPHWIERGKLQIERYKTPTATLPSRIITATEAIWAYEYGLRDETWLRSALADLYWTTERIDLQVERSKKRMEMRLKPPPTVTYRNLTTGMIRDLHRARKITSEALPSHFEKIGYNTENAQMLAQITREIVEKELLPKPWTRGDIRAMYDMRVLSVPQVKQAYMDLGYDEEHSEKLTIWARVSVDFPDLRARYRNGWITEKQLIEELWNLGLSPERAIELAETVIKAEAPERVVKERDLTKSEIVKGVKKEIITWEQGVALLMDLGYEDWEANYILAVNLIVVAGDPDSYWEMKKVTELYKRSATGFGRDVPQEVLDLSKAIEEKKADIEKEKAEGVMPERIATKETELGELEKELRHLLKMSKLA